MKKIHITLLFVVLLTFTLIKLFVGNKEDKFSLDDNYYNTEERFIEIDQEELENLITNKKSFVLFTYLPYCTFSIPCDVVFETFLNENSMSFLKIPFDELSKVEYFNKIKYAPSIILVDHGNIVTYLDANSDDDLEKYQDSKIFSDWIGKYIKLK